MNLNSERLERERMRKSCKNCGREVSGFRERKCHCLHGSRRRESDWNIAYNLQIWLTATYIYTKNKTKEKGRWKRKWIFSFSFLFFSFTSSLFHGCFGRCFVISICTNLWQEEEICVLLLLTDLDIKSTLSFTHTLWAR